MKKLLSFFKVEIERLFWIGSLGLITIVGFITFISGLLKLEYYFIGLCIIVGLGYVASVLKKSKTEIINDKVKELLVENKDSGSPVGAMSDLDSLNRVMKELGPLVNQINNNKQILKS